MPSVIQGFVVTTKTKDPTLESFPTGDTIAAGAAGITQIVAQVAPTLLTTERARWDVLRG